MDLFKKCRTLEKEIRNLKKKTIEEKVRNEANLGPNNLWKAVKIAQDHPQSFFPDTMLSR